MKKSEIITIILSTISLILSSWNFVIYIINMNYIQLSFYEEYFPQIELRNIACVDDFGNKIESYNEEGKLVKNPIICHYLFENFGRHHGYVYIETTCDNCSSVGISNGIFNMRSGEKLYLNTTIDPFAGENFTFNINYSWLFFNFGKGVEKINYNHTVLGNSLKEPNKVYHNNEDMNYYKNEYIEFNNITVTNN